MMSCSAPNRGASRAATDSWLGGVGCTNMCCVSTPMYVSASKGFRAGGVAFPVEAGSGGLEDADDRVSDFGADSVAGNERDSVRFLHGVGHFFDCVKQACAQAMSYL